MESGGFFCSFDSEAFPGADFGIRGGKGWTDGENQKTDLPALLLALQDEETPACGEGAGRHYRRLRALADGSGAGLHPVPGCLDDVILLPLHAAFSDFSSLLNQAQNKSGASSRWMAFLAFNPSAWQISVNQSPISCAHLHNFRFHSTAQPDPYGKLHERLTAQAVRAQNRSSALLR